MPAITMIPLILEYGAKYGPAAMRLVRGMIQAMQEGKEPTDEEWAKLESMMDKHIAASYKDMIPNSNLP